MSIRATMFRENGQPYEQVITPETVNRFGWETYKPLKCDSQNHAGEQSLYVTVGPQQFCYQFFGDEAARIDAYLRGVIPSVTE